MLWRQLHNSQAFTIMTDKIVRVKISNDDYIFINENGYVHHGSWYEKDRADLIPQGEFLVTGYTIGGLTLCRH